MDTNTKENYNSNEDYLEAECQLLFEWVQAYIDVRNKNNKSQFSEQIRSFYHRRDQLVADRQVAVSSGVDIPLDTMVHQHKLNKSEELMMVIMLCFYVSADLHNLLLCAQGNRLKTELELSFIASLLEYRPSLLTDPAHTLTEKLTQTRLLFTHQNTSGDNNPMQQSLSMPRYLVDAIMGRSAVDATLQRCCKLIAPKQELFDVIMPQNTRQVIGEFIRTLRKNSIIHRRWLLTFVGQPGVGKSMIIEGMVKHLISNFTVYIWDR